MGKEHTSDHLPIGTIENALNERREIVHRHEQYSIQTFTEADNPAGAFRAQQLQGESYVAAGFLYEDALDEDGRLKPELDRSRGGDVVYKLATSITGDPTDQAALRMISLPEGGRLQDLAAYKYSQNSLFEGAESALQAHIDAYGSDSLKEIAALAKGNKAGDLSSFELIRNIIQESLRDETNEAWLITFARPAFDAIQKNFGKRALTQIGYPVEVDAGDPRTSEDLRLVPTLIKPNTVLDGLVQDIDDAADDLKQQRRLVRTLMFVADGMKKTEMSDEAYQRVEFMNRLLEAS